MANCQPNRANVVFGLMLVLLGGLLALHTTGLVPWPPAGLWWLSFWGLVFVSLGLARLFVPDAGRGREGWGLLFVGCWLLLNQTHVLRYRDSWPILVIGIGIGIVWNALAARTAKPE